MSSYLGAPSLEWRDTQRYRVSLTHGQPEETMQIGSIVRSSHIAVPAGALGVVMRIIGDMAMVTWYAGQPGASHELNTEPFFLEDLIETGEQVPSAPRAVLH